MFNVPVEYEVVGMQDSVRVGIVHPKCRTVLFIDGVEFSRHDQCVVRTVLSHLAPKEYRSLATKFHKC